LPSYGKDIRLRRILHPDRGTLVVAFDHAGVLGPIQGTGDPGGQIARFVEGGADAVLLNLGLIRYLVGAAPAHPLPALIARLDWTTAMGTASQLPGDTFQSCLVAHPEDALRAGADAVITFLVVGTGDGNFEKSEIRRNARVARECEEAGIPLIVETVARGTRVQNSRSPEWLKLHTRIAAELGADLIKSEYSGDRESMRGVVEACPIPILVLGGIRTGSDQDVLQIVHDIMQAGAAGVFFGRNVFQSEKIPELLQNIRLVLSGSLPATRT
jgi:fructose-bisphosphate aldolase/2-amino-3,7-dideoxy-D-threo-hept-6-ulosonate synthase